MSGLITPGGRLASSKKKDNTINKVLEFSRKQEFDVQIKNPDKKKLKKALKDFANEPVPKILESYQILDHTRIVVKLFRYEEETELLSANGEDKKKSYLIKPYVKVLKTTEEFEEETNVKAGDILLAPDNISVIERSVEHMEYEYRMANERPQPQLREPLPYVGKVMDWREQYMFVVDKENPSEEDLWTFFIPAHFFQMGIDKKLLK